MDATARVRGLFELTRPMNTTAAGLLTFIGAFVAVGDTVLTTPAPVLAAVGATWFATAAGNAINDYFDREIDAINRPERAIPRGDVSPRLALGFSLVLFAGSVVCALFLPLVAIAIAVLNLVALVAYTRLFKGLPGVGNLVVAYLGGSTFLFGGAAVDAVGPTLVLFLLAALSTFAREIVKDVEDVEGDREADLDTLPLVIGERRSLWVASGVLLVAVGASPLPYLLGIFGPIYLGLVIPADLLMLSGVLISFREPGSGQRRLKWGMFLAAGAFVAGRVALLISSP